MSDHDEAFVRNYRPGDDAAIISLFNRAFRNYVGFVPRTLEYWSWYYKSRYDVKQDGIIILEHHDRIVAYAIIGETGNIWEFCYDRENERKKEFATLLMEKVVKHASSSEASEIRFHAPQSDKLVAEICNSMGFTNSNFRYFFLSVSDFEVLIKKILDKRRVKSFRGKTFKIFLVDAPKWMGSELFVEFNASNAVVTTKTSKKIDVIIETTVSGLTEVIFRRKNLPLSFLRREIKVTPTRKFLTGIGFLKLLCQNGVWFTPQGDC